MKAIEINGEIKTFGTLPKSWTDNNGTHFNLKDGSHLGFKDVVIPDYDSRVQQLSNLHLDGDVYTYDVVDIEFSETLAELKENKIKGLKLAVGEELAKTDWYIIREADSGEATPQSIKDERAALRTKSDSIEAEINALTTKKAVVLFDINL
jgi:hypothetical protein